MRAISVKTIYSNFEIKKVFIVLKSVHHSELTKKLLGYLSIHLINLEKGIGYYQKSNFHRKNFFHLI